MRSYSATKASTKALLASLSRSGDHWAVLCTPSAASPTAASTSWLKEKPGPIIGMPVSDWANCLAKAMPMPPGWKKKTLSAPEALIWAISAAKSVWPILV